MSARELTTVGWGVLPRTPHPEPRTGERGLTLAELVLTVTLFVFLMGAVGGLLLSAVHAQVRWGASVAPSQELDRALHRLTEDFATAQPLFGVPFVGGSDRVEFARLARPTGSSSTAAEWLRIAYQLEPSGDGLALVREESVWRTTAEGGGPDRRDALATLDAAAFAFAVHETAEAAELAWVDTWDAEAYHVAPQALPQLIRLSLSVPTGPQGPSVSFLRVIQQPAGTLPVLEEAS